MKLFWIWDNLNQSKFTNKTTDELSVYRIFKSIKTWEKYRYEIKSEETNDAISQTITNG